MKSYTGFTEQTAENLLLDSGAYFKNYEVGKDTFETAVAAGKLLGATKGGGEFSATPTVRKIEVDGVRGRAKGLERLDEWEVYINANVLEVTKDTLVHALGAAKVDEGTIANYTVISGKNEIDLTDYINNITWIGTISGTNEPVIIQVYNALGVDGLKLTTKDKDDTVVAMKFYGHYEPAKLDKPPFDIYYPKADAAAAANVEDDGTEG